MNTDYLKNSKDYKERFVAEYSDLLTRTAKLRTMLIQWDAGMLDFKPLSPKRLFKKQLRYMSKNLDTLEKRAKIENIDIQKIMNKELHRQEEEEKCSNK